VLVALTAVPRHLQRTNSKSETYSRNTAVPLPARLTNFFRPDTLGWWE